MKPITRTPSATIYRKVECAHIDGYRICAYPHYTEFMGSAVMELFDNCGVTAELDKLGLQLRVARLNFRYRRSAKRNNLLKITAALSKKIGKCTLRFSGLISRGATPLSNGKMVVVFVNEDEKMQRIPPSIGRLLAAQPDDNGRNAA